MHMISRFALAALVLGAAATAAQDKDRLYTVSSANNLIRLVDPVAWTTVSSVAMTAAGATIRGANGLSVHPATGEIYVALTIIGTTARSLGKVDPTTGVVTMIGSLGQQFAGLAFSATGTLYGVTGDGATTPETLYTIDTNTAATTQILALGNGSDGETICFDPTGKLLHASGLAAQVLESIDLNTLQVANVPMSGDAWSEVLSLTHLAGRNYLAVDLDDVVFVVTDGGLRNQLGTLDHSFVKGIALVPAGNAATFRVYGDGCDAAGGLIPILVGSGTPSPGATVTLGIANGPAGVPAVMSLGAGTGSFPLTPTCRLQNMPIFPSPLIPLALAGTNPGDGTATLPLPIPASLPPLSLYFHAVIVETPSLNLIVTNPLQARIQ